MNKTPLLIGSSLSAMGSSIIAATGTFCCVGPAIAAVLGTGGALAASQLAPYRPYFLACSLLLLALGFWLAYRPRGACIGKACVTQTSKITRALLWLAAFLTLAAILLPIFVRE